MWNVPPGAPPASEESLFNIMAMEDIFKDQRT
jgi:hypothetical protein